MEECIADMFTISGSKIKPRTRQAIRPHIYPVPVVFFSHVSSVILAVIFLVLVLAFSILFAVLIAVVVPVSAFGVFPATFAFSFFIDCIVPVSAFRVVPLCLFNPCCSGCTHFLKFADISLRFLTFPDIS